MKGCCVIDGIGFIIEDDGVLTIKGTYEEVAFIFIGHNIRGSITVADCIHIHSSQKIFEWIGDEKDRPSEFDELKKVFDRVYDLSAFS